MTDADHIRVLTEQLAESERSRKFCTEEMERLSWTLAGVDCTLQGYLDPTDNYVGKPIHSIERALNMRTQYEDAFNTWRCARFSIKVIFAWYSGFIGWLYERYPRRILYISLIPFIIIKIQLNNKAQERWYHTTDQDEKLQKQYRLQHQQVITLRDP